MTQTDRRMSETDIHHPGWCSYEPGLQPWCEAHVIESGRYISGDHIEFGYRMSLQYGTELRVGLLWENNAPLEETGVALLLGANRENLGVDEANMWRIGERIKMTLAEARLLAQYLEAKCDRLEREVGR